jgi:hypothetical protein
MCVDIEGVLRWPDKQLSMLFTENGVNRPGRYVRDWLKLQLAHGKKVLPMGECDNFDYQTGCKGHPINETETDL